MLLGNEEQEEISKAREGSLQSFSFFLIFFKEINVVLH